MRDVVIVNANIVNYANWRYKMEHPRLLDERQILTEARIRIPFLRDIPDQMYWRLDPRDWVLPDKSIDKLRLELEEITGQNVMTYTYESSHWNRSVSEHLCGIIAPAALSEYQTAELMRIEGLIVPRNVSLSVYKKPIEIILPEKSWLGQFFKDMRF